MFSVDLVGNTQILHNLLQKVVNNQLHNSIIFAGNRGIGKFSYAMLFAKILLSYDINEMPKNIYDLEIDNNVEALIKANSSRNLLLIQPEFDVKNQKFKDIIGVEEVRKINDFLHMSSANNGYKLVIIDSINNLNINSANAILKNLEEPPKNTFFILIYHNGQKILDTIKSRCVNYDFKALSNVDIKHLIVKNNINIVDDLALDLMAISNGSWADFLFFSQNDNLKVYKILQEILSMHNGANKDKKIYDYIAMLKNLDYGKYDFLFDVIYQHKINHLQVFSYKHDSKLKYIVDMKKNINLLNLDKNSVLLNLLFNY
jgi:DNA polymerase-3 subunit delta'